MIKSIIGSARRPDITFHENGRIDITARVARRLGLHAGDCIDVGVLMGEYYLYVRHRGREDTDFLFEATVRPTKKRSRNFRAHSVRLCREILRMYGGEVRVSPQLGQPVYNQLFGPVIPLIRRRIGE